MKEIDLYNAFQAVDDDILERSEAACGCKRRPVRLKWGVLAACFVLVFAAAVAMLPDASREPVGVVPPSDPLIESAPVQIGDARAEAWFTAEELGAAAPEGVVSGGLCVPTFISYRGGFYGGVDMEQAGSPLFAPAEEDLLFNRSYTRTVYLVENHPDWIAVHINGMEIYEKIFDVTFAVDGTTYAIACSPVMDGDYGLGGMVLETGDYTVYEAVRLQGEPAQTTEYIVDILPLLQRERPNLFDGSGLEPGGSYADQWQLALPLE